MKKNTIVSLFFFVVVTAPGRAQAPGAATKLKAQAVKMGTSFLHKDFKSFSAYTNPAVLEMVGGSAGMEQIMTGVTDGMKQRGMSFEDVSMGEPSGLIKSGKEWQATIPEYIVIATPNGKFRTTSTLIAISADNGENWTFMDTSDKDTAIIRKLLPNLSPSIVIPPRQPVVNVTDK